METQQKRLGAWQSLVIALRSKRTAAVCLLSFSSGLPLGLVWTAIPDWLRSSGVDIQYVGLITLVQAPWTLKMLWAPLVDHFKLPFLDLRRGWVACMQVILFALCLGLAGLGHNPDTPWVIGALALAIAFASATQDIALDAYAVEILQPEEQGVVVGARIALYRVAMFAAGGFSISLAGHYSWPVANAMIAILFLSMVFVTKFSPSSPPILGRAVSLKEAYGLPFVEFLSRPKAYVLLGFMFFYKFGDNFSGALLRPFLVDMNYNSDDRGILVGVVSIAATIVATLLGGILSNALGLVRSLWIFGVLQIVSNVGYVYMAQIGIPDRLVMSVAILLELFCTGLGAGAFGVLLLRATEKKYAAAQYAFFSVLFAIPRMITGPMSGYLMKALGCDTGVCAPDIWEKFFWISLPMGIPGLIFLYFLVPFRAKEIDFKMNN